LPLLLFERQAFSRRTVGLFIGMFHQVIRFIALMISKSLLRIWTFSRVVPALSQQHTSVLPLQGPQKTFRVNYMRCSFFFFFFFWIAGDDFSSLPFLAHETES
jgi:hypothetical protein